MTDRREHVFRHPEIVQRLPVRDWLRENLPHSSQGVVVDDLDLIVRTWGANYHTGPFGRFKLIETKFGAAWPAIGQLLTFKGIDQLLRRADPERLSYLGFYIVQQWQSDWQSGTYAVNKMHALDQVQFKAFLLGGLDLPGYDFNRVAMSTGLV